MQNKKILFLFFFSGIVLLNACMQNASTKFTEEDETLIRETIDKAMQLYNETGNMLEYAKLYYAEDAVVLAPNADPVKGMDAIVEFLGMFPDFSIKFEILEIKGAEDLAYAYGFYELDFGEGIPGDKGKYIEIWKKQENGLWRITYDIFNTSLPITEADDDEDNDDGDDD